MPETLNSWKVSKDSKNEVFGERHFVAKRSFDKEGSGLSLMARENHGYYTIELAIEVNGSVDSCFRLDNAAIETEALEIVDQITEAI